MIERNPVDAPVALQDTKTAAAAVVAINPKPQSLEYKTGLVGAVASFTGIKLSALLARSAGSGKDGGNTTSGITLTSTLAVATTVAEAGAKADAASDGVGNDVGAQHELYTREKRLRKRRKQKKFYPVGGT